MRVRGVRLRDDDWRLKRNWTDPVVADRTGQTGLSTRCRGGFVRSEEFKSTRVSVHNSIGVDASGLDYSIKSKKKEEIYYILPVLIRFPYPDLVISFYLYSSSNYVFFYTQCAGHSITIDEILLALHPRSAAGWHIQSLPSTSHQDRL